jgi:serine/threonine protein kinase
LDLVGHDVGAYRILSLLGRGGTAEVYKAFHPALKREVAVKVLLQEVVHDVDWVRRFRQEAELLGRLDHPHILPIYDAGEHEGRPFLVMKYMVDTTTLRSQLHGQPWPLNRVVKVVTQVGDALDAAHKSGVVHRDIKPSNILVTPDLRCSVFDFGIAKPFRRRGDTTTGSDHIVGTPEFMSPEQCKGDRIDHRSDIYSLGVMTYQMLAGHVPFTAETAVGILMKHLTEPLPIPPKGVALPPAVNGVLRKAMAREPRERFATAGELAEAMRLAADQRATVTLHASEIQRAATSTLKVPAWVRTLRSPETRMTLAGLALAGMLVGIFALWPKTPPPALEGLLEPPISPIEAGESSGSREASAEMTGMMARPAPREASAVSRTHRTGADDETLARLEIDSTEPAKVLLDGHPIGTAPGAFDAVRPGRHVVALDAGRGRLDEKSLIVTAGSTHRLRFDFSETPKDVTATTLLPHQLQGEDSLGRDGAARRGARATPMLREWVGFLTDEDCGTTGGEQGALHLRCAERCIRDGQQPMLYSRGKLYRLDGLDRLTLVRGEPLRFKGWLEATTVHVVEPIASAAPTSSDSR